MSDRTADDDYMSMFADEPGAPTANTVETAPTTQMPAAAPSAAPAATAVAVEPATETGQPAGPAPHTIRRRPFGVTSLIKFGVLFAVLSFGYNAWQARSAGSADQADRLAALTAEAQNTGDDDDDEPQVEPFTPEGMSAVLDSASQWRASYGSFYGFTPPEGYLMAVGYGNIVLSAWDGDVCRIGGMVNGSGPTVADDPTGQGCSLTAITEAQAAIDSAENG